MSDNNSDKTKIKKPEGKSDQINDKTRLTPKNVDKSSVPADKTRLAPNRRIAPDNTVVQQQNSPPKAVQQSGDTDKTRIARKPVQGPANKSDATRIAQKPVGQPSNKTDATRIAQKPVRQASNNADATRIAKKPVQQPSNNADVTRIAQKPVRHTSKENEAVPVATQDSEGVEKTQVVTAGEIPDNLPLETVDISQMGDHGVLKKRFVLESVLGAGGMGIVYKARDLLKVEAQDRDPYVAIKVLGEEFKSHPKAFISLQRESRKSQRIAHPNIVNVHDFDRDGDTVFMTMEFLDGSPLDQLIRKYKSTGLPTEDAWVIIKGMCAALAHAHAEKIIHSDFKPGNVFVTKKGLAKVFDFGIARAVAKVEKFDEPGKQEDKTLFDAGNLGALTPAYASLEMLEGKEPDIRDDIFALGCVAYELFTAEHPYKKIPADEAQKLRIKPKKITNISKRQWRAIERAIAFKREDRIATVDEFLEEISPKTKTSNLMATIFALLLSVAITVYFVYFQEKTPAEPAFSEDDITLKVTMDILKQDIQQLIDKPLFSNAWQDSVWMKFSELKSLTKEEIPWVVEKKKQIYALYLAEINSYIKELSFTEAGLLIKNAKRYTDDTSELDSKSRYIAKAIEEQKIKQAAAEAAAEEKRKEQRLLAEQQRQKKLAQQKADKAKNKQQKQNAETTKSFDVALENVNNQLKCIGRLDMRNIEIAVMKLREVDLARYKSMEDKIVGSLASCIQHTGKLNPERATEAKRQSLRIFKSNKVLAAINIQAKDACDESLAGLGSRGKRALCKDKIKGAGNGPELVVIPGNKRVKVFAIGKYEVSIEEFNNFCSKSSSCSTITGKDVKLPVTGIDISTAEKYMNWLSLNTGKKYRLPTKTEWIYAAKSRSKSLDANRNCKISTRGIQKGEGLVITSIGKQNSWGLVNYVGNAQEWVYDKGRKLKAVGGSYTQALENCDITTTNTHDGSADNITGFRVIREVNSSS